MIRAFALLTVYMVILTITSSWAVAEAKSPKNPAPVMTKKAGSKFWRFKLNGKDVKLREIETKGDLVVVRLNGTSNRWGIIKKVLGKKGLAQGVIAPTRYGLKIINKNTIAVKIVKKKGVIKLVKWKIYRLDDKKRTLTPISKEMFDGIIPRKKFCIVERKKKYTLTTHDGKQVPGVNQRWFKSPGKIDLKKNTIQFDEAGQTFIYDLNTGKATKESDDYVDPDKKKAKETDDWSMSSTEDETNVALARGCTPVNIEEVVESGAVDISLTGDGETTSHCTLALHNNSDQSLLVNVPAFQCFVPPTDKYQTMMTTEEKQLVVSPGETVAEDIPTVCTSGKNISPPTEELVGYKPADHSDLAAANLFADLITSAKELNNNGNFAAVPIPEQRRDSTIAQLAIWKYIGDETPSTVDDVTPRVVKDDLLTGAHVTENVLSKKQEKQLDSSIENIFTAVDMTLKRGKQHCSNRHLSHKSVDGHKTW